MSLLLCITLDVCSSTFVDECLCLPFSHSRRRVPHLWIQSRATRNLRWLRTKSLSLRNRRGKAAFPVSQRPSVVFLEVLACAKASTMRFRDVAAQTSGFCGPERRSMYQPQKIRWSIRVQWIVGPDSRSRRCLANAPSMGLGIPPCSALCDLFSALRFRIQRWGPPRVSLPPDASLNTVVRDC